MSRDAPVVPSISAIVLTHNEGGRIARCLESLEPCVAEMLVVDSGSTDDTRRIAIEHGATVVEHPFTDYAEQRNWAQQNLPLSNEWVFHVDADEHLDASLTAWLRGSFRQISEDPHVAGILIRRRIRFLDRDILHGGVYPTYHCRLFRRRAGWCEPRLYDQHFVVVGELVRARGDLIEDNGTDVIAWCQKHLRWAELEARELRRRLRCPEVPGRTDANRLRACVSGNPLERRRWLREKIYGRAPRLWRAWFYFAYRMVVRLGFLDGWRGTVYHLLHGLWFRLVVDTIIMMGDCLKHEHNEAAARGTRGFTIRDT